MLRLAFFLTVATSIATAYAQVDSLRAFFELEAGRINTHSEEEFKLDWARLQARIDVFDEQVDNHMTELKTRIASGTCDPALMDLTLDLVEAYARLTEAISNKSGQAEDMLVEEMEWKNRALEAYFTSVRPRR